jgi:hypothetical protein
MIQQALQKLFAWRTRPAGDPRANADRQPDIQIREWLASKEQQRVSNLDTAERDAAAMHTAILEELSGVDPDDLATLTRGRVTCPMEHREVLRALIARPVPLETGMVVPWRLEGDIQCAVHWTTWARVQQDAWDQEAWSHRSLEYWLRLTFLTHAKRHARVCGWRWRIIQDAEVEAIHYARAHQLLRLAVECPPNRLRLVFAPPTAQEQDAARRIREAELGFQRLAEARMRTRSLLARVMR